MVSIITQRNPICQEFITVGDLLLQDQEGNLGYMDTWRGRAKAVMREKEITQEAVAEKIGVTQGAVAHWLSGRRKIGIDEINKFADVLGVDRVWLQFGDATAGGAEKQAEPVHIRELRTRAEDIGESMHVPIFDADASMGIGKPQPDIDTVVGSMQINPAWIKQQLPAISSPGNLAVLTAYGDSMEPTFNDGDMLLVDRGVDDVRLDAVYVLSFNQELFVKRIQRRMDGSIAIKSDNPLYDPCIVQNGDRDRLIVLGRVVWAWHGKKL